LHYTCGVVHSEVGHERDFRKEASLRRTSVVLVVASLFLVALAAPPSAESKVRRAKPRPDAVVAAPPLLRWRPVSSAVLYNVQLWRDGRKLLSRWPERARLQLHRTWRYKNHRFRLRPAAYRWYVWPWLGSRFGRVRVRSRFIVGRIPVNTVRPVVSGRVREGETLTATTGRWTGTRPIHYAYRWRRCDRAGASCVTIPGAAGPSRRLAAADIAATLRVIVTATNLARSRSAASVATGVVLPAPPVNVARPRLWGPLQQRATLTADTGAWTSSRPLTYSFVWQRCEARGGCANVRGAVEQAYRLTAADVENRVRALVTATNPGGSRTAFSVLSAAIGRVFLGTTGDDALVGTRGADLIRARRGDDSVRAGGGPDRVNAGGGSDRVRGGGGNDVIRVADRDRDTVDCGSGHDRVVADRRDRLTDCETVERRRRPR
jgi:RTX calcium-binding nonapeptide repeat (4 copies)